MKKKKFEFNHLKASVLNGMFLLLLAFNVVMFKNNRAVAASVKS